MIHSMVIKLTLQDIRLRISSWNYGRNITENATVRQYKVTPTHTHTHKHRDTNPQQLPSMSPAPHHCLPPLPLQPHSHQSHTPHHSPATSTQRSHILHTPLPPLWAQPQLWNHTANNSLACSLPLVSTVPPAINYDTWIIQNSMICPF